MKPNTNIFGQKICTRDECPAFFNTDDGYGGCDAKLDHHGRISLGIVPIQFGMVCGLPIEFEIVRREDVLCR